MDINTSVRQRVQWINDILASSGAKGVIYGNSGGKDCSLVSILCKMATDNVVGVIMPCQSSQNYGSDRDDALKVGAAFGIPQMEVDLTEVKNAFMSALGDKLTDGAVSEYNVHMAGINVNPRLRMTALYALGQAKGYLVAGTGNLDEATLGYFTKWGDGAYDFNPIADLTVGEIYEHLRFLGCPSSVIDKAPSAGLYAGQTDEKELGISYSDVDKYLKGGKVDDAVAQRIRSAERSSAHKRRMPLMFGKD